MGANKALLSWEGVPLVVRVAARLGEAVAEVVVVTREPADFEGLGLTVVRDGPGPQTPLCGIRTVIRLAGGRPAAVVACDMPHLEPAFVGGLLGLVGGYDAVVPVRGRGPEPLHAVWQPSALRPIDEALAAGELAPRRLLRRLDVCWVEEEEWRAWDPQGRSLVNLNTPEDVERERPPQER